MVAYAIDLKSYLTTQLITDQVAHYVLSTIDAALGESPSEVKTELSQTYGKELVPLLVNVVLLNSELTENVVRIDDFVVKVKVHVGLIHA